MNFRNMSKFKSPDFVADEPSCLSNFVNLLNNKENKIEIATYNKVLFGVFIAIIIILTISLLIYEKHFLP